MNKSRGLVLLILFGFRTSIHGLTTIHFSNSHSQDTSANQPLIVFLHGRLEADAEEAPYAAPSKLYNDFLEKLPPTHLVEYDKELAEPRKLAREPRDLRIGPISSSLQDSIQDILSKHADGSRKVDLLITFSMGAAMGFKLLHHCPEVFDRVVLIEPVWRCWLPFVVSNPRPICNVPTLALYGTNDALTRDDSGKSVLGSLRAFFSNLKVVPIQGGNHWGILNEDVAISKEGLADNLTPAQLQDEMFALIEQFCNWE